MKPEISIIVPVYNVENYLEDCLDSILAQSFQNFEVILVNDGSTDKSGFICDDYTKKDDRIKVVHQDYRGVSSARNVGIAKAEGELIGFVDSDDRIDIHMYNTLYELCKETGSDISICKLGREIDGQLINGDNQEFVKVMDNEEGLRELFKGVLFRFSLCNKLFKKSCFNDASFPEGRIHEDLATTYKLFAAAEKSIYTNYIGYIYIKRQNSILTSKFNEKRLDAFVVWEEILEFMTYNYKNIEQEVIASFGYWCVDNMHYILNQVNNNNLRETYLYEIKKVINKRFIRLIINKTLSMKHKLTITMLRCSIKLVIHSSDTKKSLRIN